MSKVDSLERFRYFAPMRFARQSLIMTAFLGAICTQAFASSSPNELGKFGYWTAYKMTDNGQPVCYMSITSRPTAEKQKSKRGEVVLMITHRPADNSTDVVSYTAGLKYKQASEVSIVIGAKKFDLFTQGDTAWSRDVATDHALATAIRSNEAMVVNGQTTRNTAITDKLNLKGSFEAYSAINKACGLPPPEAQRTKKAAKPQSKTPKKKKN